MGSVRWQCHLSPNSKNSRADGQPVPSNHRVTCGGWVYGVFEDDSALEVGASGTGVTTAETNDGFRRDVDFPITAQ
ncbi:hypothetical protein VNO77_41148 [Canavalia gladiata]|uniref:Uncharacterized protein n=1 Tax=Canavalia gladiata TaxID=3824 RepID=A0AAN9K0H4_CANGL